MNIYIETIVARMVYLNQILFRKYKGPYSKSILIVRPEGIGDMIYTIPFLRELKRNYPNYKVDLVCSNIEENMMELCPYIDNVFVFDTKTKRHRFKTLLQRSSDFAKKYLVNEHYEIAISPSYANPGAYLEAWLCFFSKAKRRICMSEKVNAKKHKLFMGTYDMYFTERLYEKNIYHEVESGLTFLRYLGGAIESDSLELWESTKDKEKIKNLFNDLLIDKNTIKIIVNLSTSARYKDWPVKYYIEVCKKIMENYSVSFFLIGAGNTAREYADTYLQYIPQAYNFVDQMTICQTFELMKHSDLYLGGDTGPVHMAAACKLRGVAIYSTAKDYCGEKQSDASRWFAAWKSNLAIVQPEHALPGCEGGCIHNEPHCICQVNPNQVYTELVKQIKNIKYYWGQIY